MKVKHLESALQVCLGFEKPKWELEQYNTTPHLAARTVFAAGNLGDIEDQTILDMGCGSGILGIAACLLGAHRVVGVDVDPDALRLAAENAERVGVRERFEFVNADVVHWPFVASRGSSTGTGKVEEGEGAATTLFDCTVGREEEEEEEVGWADTVLMNPPFGTRTAGIDVLFLERGLQTLVPGGVLYSMHKTSTREFLQRKATEQWGVGFEVLAELRFDIPAMYKFHRKKSVDVAVDLIRLVKPGEHEEEEEEEEG